MTLSRSTKARLLMFSILFLLLPGFPIWPILLSMTGGGFFALILHNVYYSLPSTLLGTEQYPIEEFGILPTLTGYLIAFFLYGLLAIMLFTIACVIMKVIQRRNQQGTESDVL